MRMQTRRDFFRTASAAAGAAVMANYYNLAAKEMERHKITDVKVMMMQGPRTYTLIKIETDTGFYGIGEGYGNPGVGVKEQVLALKPEMIGKDPLQIDTLYTKFQYRTDGSMHMLIRAVSGVEIALWDLAGKILNVPAVSLLGGRFRDKVRMYNHRGPRNWLDKASCREWAQEKLSDPAGFTCVKFGLTHSDPAVDKARDPSHRLLTSRELREVRQGFENCREAIGWEHDIIVHCHWEYDLRTSIQLAEAIEPIKPLFLEDPLPVEYAGSWQRLCLSSNVPICMGENLTRRQGFKDFIVNQGADIIQPDIRNSGGLLETKKIADLADIYYLPMCHHNTGSLINTMATVTSAASIRDYLACETVIGRHDWMDEVILHEGKIVQGGHINVPDKPGLGIELNPDVVKAHLAQGETYWT